MIKLLNVTLLAWCMHYKVLLYSLYKELLPASEICCYFMIWWFFCWRCLAVGAFPERALLGEVALRITHPLRASRSSHSLREGQIDVHLLLWSGNGINRITQVNRNFGRRVIEEIFYIGKRVFLKKYKKTVCLRIFLLVSL